MITRNFVRRNHYSDSVSLMLLSSKLTKMPGVIGAAVMMATDNNKVLMRRSQLLLEESETASPSDMIIALKVEGEEMLAEVQNVVEDFFSKTGRSANFTENDPVVRTQDMALKMFEGANLAIISIPGRYAAREAKKALERDLHVLLFSDNVSLEDEKELKKMAVAKGLLMMGPDCGTSIINGYGLGFANAVRKGGIGLVAASGTGLQEVSCIINKHGGGISQAIGTGGRDVKSSVGGIMMMAGLQALSSDHDTEVIVLVSKPPDKPVLDQILEVAGNAGKPVVSCFLGAVYGKVPDNVLTVRTLEEAAIRSIELSASNKGLHVEYPASGTRIREVAESGSCSFRPPQRFLRGLFSGGTLCYEALLLLSPVLGDIYSNIPFEPRLKLLDPGKSIGHTLLDLGDDYFTESRPHPMIDASYRVERFEKEASDPETAVILLDVVLGYGSHPDPAGVLVDPVSKARTSALLEGRNIIVIASVCGTPDDPQDLTRQEEKLREAGVLVMPSNAQASALATAIISMGR